MAGGTWLGLETARRGLNTHRYALDITGQNLANASTIGYTRQEAIIRATDPYTVPSMNSSCTPGQFGTGSMVDYIRRVKDEYMDNNVRRSTSDNSYWADQVSVMQRAEACFAEPAAKGISQKIVDFFKSWMDLQNNSGDLGVKSTVVEIGSNLATLLGTVYKQLNSIEKSVLEVDSSGEVQGGMMQDQVNQVNDILTQINDLTNAIKKVYDVGQQPNDLLDRRDLLLEELSHYGPVHVTDGNTNGKPNGELEVTFFGTKVLDSNADLCFNDMKLGLDAGNLVIGSAKSGGEIVNLSTKLADQEFSGSLVGLVNARQELIAEQDKLNELAIALKDEVNTILDSSGDDFEKIFFSGSLADGDFVVNPDLLNDPNKLDGAVADKVSKLRDKDVLGESTFSEYYSYIVTDVGNAAANANSMAANQAAIKQQITSLRDSVSGVSIDEELTKMMQFQYGWQASSRMITVVDQLIDMVINRMGV
ncbi:flagellar hook-associated protein FlgK [Desulforamulus ruminis]|uniref:Flagellar hook-associated protein 1 n=1 Tax=Desulforamulus ruminis (strain ATCC 23193 / DSM 2154 / NCIMB 8452 / DL) TaxID=696281 RepID=F6DNP1_DESRL|nr:flagellar hook-associated protein FlgK [Desulforamulus ruminis]AEG59486.1 flagellar hook-associated protein FlgK [Desulforamulus ruminis DSM 2154]